MLPRVSRHWFLHLVLISLFVSVWLLSFVIFLFPHTFQIGTKLAKISTRSHATPLFPTRPEGKPLLEFAYMKFAFHMSTRLLSATLQSVSEPAQICDYSHGCHYASLRTRHVDHHKLSLASARRVHRQLGEKIFEDLVVDIPLPGAAVLCSEA